MDANIDNMDANLGNGAGVPKKTRSYIGTNL